MASNKALKVGIIIGTQRVVRVGPQIANFVLNTIRAVNEKASHDTTTPRPPITFDIVDVKTHNLPIFDEPGIPRHIKSADEYANEHTRVWSRCIADLDAFIFISSQRNWGIPAELKNAIDYLYHEWSTKPAMIITYGGHGGHQCAGHLKTVLGSIGVRVVDKTVGMAFPTPEFRDKCFEGQELELDASNDAGPWAEHQSEIVLAWDDLVNKMLVV
ncbi:flavo protein [Periconia macrospinosa]|uniref:Flavo protein n=1 Tax=Periconia macrospinosa TaxID=97972 RepID=A0A2V1E780_9PLEO|nr:flavo protein [Periconia macrospinosa]